MTVDTGRSPHARWRSLSLDEVSITGGFWAQRQRINHSVSLDHGYRMLEEAGNLHNLQLAAGTTSGDYRGPVFMDSDVYKWLEAVGYAESGHSLLGHANHLIGLIERAQAKDGYLDSYYQVVAPDRRWVELNTGHELYCAGHLTQAAIAWHRYKRDDRLLRLVERLIHHIAQTFGPDKRDGLPGHPEIEMALVELYRVTNRQEYLDLTQFFIDQRGFGKLGPSCYGGPAYYQDRVPIRDATQLEGHAVRALYLTAGVTDLYMETGEQALLDAMLRQWSDLVAHKVYVTGGAGSRHSGESFGQPYELANDRAYCETCAAIASIMWSWRLLLATGESRFADLIERTFYNGFLSGVSLSGDRFFYVNPLTNRGVFERRPWFRVACCPPNVMRLIASLAHYLASCDDHGIQIHQYAATIIHNARKKLRVETDYPWSGDISITVEETDDAPWSLQLRQPAWCPMARVTVNGAEQSAKPEPTGYITLSRTWRQGDRVNLKIQMEPRLTVPHPRIESARGCVAIERGPLVYCVEQADLPDDDVPDVRLDPAGPLQATWRPDLLGGVMTIDARGGVADVSDWNDATFRPFKAAASPKRRRVALSAIPYYAWANRAPGAMQVWLWAEQTHV